MKRLCSVACAALLLGGASWAWGQEEGLFERLDANKDGVVTAEEVEGEDRKELFNRVLQRGDKNGDKKLTKDEFAAATQRRDGEQPRTDRPRDGERPRDDRPRDGEPRTDRPREGQPREGDPRPREGQLRRPDGLPDPSRQMAEQLFRRWDANEDGHVNADEVPADRREQFRRMTERLDVVDEKGITLEQFSRVAMGMMAGGPPGFGPGMPPGMPGMAVLRVLDADADGELSKEEIEGAAAALAKLDRDEDGKLSRQELMPGFPGGPGGFPGRPGEGRPDQPRPDGRPREGRPDGADQIRARIREMDTNSDGKISKEEAQGRIKENFDSFDANSDGQIDDAEIRARFERPREGERRPEGDRPDRRREEGERPGARRPPAEGDEKAKEE